MRLHKARTICKRRCFCHDLMWHEFLKHYSQKDNRGGIIHGEDNREYISFTKSRLGSLKLDSVPPFNNAGYLCVKHVERDIARIKHARLLG